MRDFIEWVVEEEKGGKKWIKGAIKEPGALRDHFGKKEGEKISDEELQTLIDRLQKKAEGDKKLSAADAKLLKQAVFARTLKGLNK